MTQFGCEKCWLSDASAAWEAVTSTEIEKHLVDEAHFIVSIRACSACSQSFLQITTETIDWKGGEDPIYRNISPITASERTELLDNKLSPTKLMEGLGSDRRVLKYDWPKGDEPSIYWGTNVRIGIHD